jgi:hypothetical protein
MQRSRTADFSRPRNNALHLFVTCLADTQVRRNRVLVAMHSTLGTPVCSNKPTRFCPAQPSRLHAGAHVRGAASPWVALLPFATSRPQWHQPIFHPANSTSHGSSALQAIHSSSGRYKMRQAVTKLLSHTAVISQHIGAPWMDGQLWVAHGKARQSAGSIPCWERVLRFPFQCKRGSKKKDRTTGRRRALQACICWVHSFGGQQSLSLCKGWSAPHKQCVAPVVSQL